MDGSKWPVWPLDFLEQIHRVPEISETAAGAIVSDRKDTLIYTGFLRGRRDISTGRVPGNSGCVA